jgi:hypothetical protein
MKNKKVFWQIVLTVIVISGCNKESSPVTPPPPAQLTVKSIWLNNKTFETNAYGSTLLPEIRVVFSQPLMISTVEPAIIFTDAKGVAVPHTTNLLQNDSVIFVKPTALLSGISKYFFKIDASIKSASGGKFISSVDHTIITQLDSSRKFPIISDNELLDKVQKQTFSYFWDFGHPVSGLARERNTSGETVTSGGSGFGVMAIITAIHRGFITRSQGLARLQLMVDFLKNKAQTFHGAYPHWLNGITGTVIPFSAKDNGADLVETSYLIQGLLSARQYFNDAGAAETILRDDINFISDRVEWNWFRKNNEDVLYWHWSPNFGWDMNMKIQGWNESLITYVLAASSTKYAIPLSVYSNGWARNGNMANGAMYAGYTLPLGEPWGGPLFYAHYSFLGINPNGLTDQYANYETQNKNHTRINYQYCRSNSDLKGYSDSVWGLTASDIPGGYTASSPTNDRGVIAPTAALSSFPYTPAESMAALKFYYYVLGDKIWKQYGFVDAFSLKDPWFADSFLAIDQGPIIIMIENYRSGLLWDLFTSCPEVKNGMRALRFSSPYL